MLQEITKLNVVRKFYSLDLRKGSVSLIVISLPQVHNCLIFPWLLLKSYLNLKVCKGGENFNLSQSLNKQEVQVYTEITSIFQMDSVLNFQSLPCFKKYPVSMVNCFLFQSFCTVFIHNKRDIYINSANCHFKLCVTYLRTFTMKVLVFGT